jgi:hypothetical protein
MEGPRRTPKRTTNGYRYKSRVFFLTKSEMYSINVHIDGISARSAPAEAGEEKPRLFENFPTTTAACEPGGGDFLSNCPAGFSSCDCVCDGCRVGGEGVEDVVALFSGCCDDGAQGGEGLSAFGGVRKPPDILIFTFMILSACSARLLVKGNLEVDEEPEHVVFRRKNHSSTES